MPRGSLIAETPDAAHGAPATRMDWRSWIESKPAIQVPENGVTGNGGRVLLISYMFPPTGGSAVQRPAKLAKYLPSFGWSVEILSADHDRFGWFDASLLQDVPAECRVHRVPGFEPACVARRMCSRVGSRSTTDDLLSTEAQGESRLMRRVEDSIYWRLVQLTGWLGMGEGQRLWIGPAVRAALRRHRERPFDVIVSTGPPHFVHRVAMRIAQATGLGWVADMRDPLVSDINRTDLSRRQTKALLRLEAAIMQQATTVVTTCPSLAEDLQDRYPNGTAAHVRAITNGFDREDLPLVDAVDRDGHEWPEDCVFAAVGAFYGRRELARIIEPLRHVLDQHPEWRGRVRLVIAGKIDAEQLQRWSNHRLDWLTLAGYVDHCRAVRLSVDAACTILMVPECHHGRLSIPGKTFELLALPSHLLALVPPGSDTERIVDAAGASTTVPLENGPRLAQAMSRIIKDHLAGQLTIERNWPAMDMYDRRAIAGEFAHCLAQARKPLRNGHT